MRKGVAGLLRGLSTLLIALSKVTELLAGKGGRAAQDAIGHAMAAGGIGHKASKSSVVSCRLSVQDNGQQSLAIRADRARTLEGSQKVGWDCKDIGENFEDDSRFRKKRQTFTTETRGHGAATQLPRRRLL